MNGGRAARLANLSAILGFGIAVLFLLAAAARGLRLSIATVPACLSLLALVALYVARRRHERDGGDERLATGAGVVLVLFCGGLAGGIICLVGQTFALPFVDPALHRGDAAMGIDLEAIIRAIVGVPGLPALLAFAYNSSFPVIFITVLAFAWSRRSEQAWEMCTTFNLCLIVVTVSSGLIPATGPFHFLAVPADLQQALPPGSGTYHLDYLFALREAEQFVIDPSRLQGVATFPSFHTALALMTASGWRDVRWMRVPMFAWQGLVVISTIPIGGHYAIDLVAGAACWALASLWWKRSLAASYGIAMPPFTLRVWPVT